MTSSGTIDAPTVTDLSEGSDVLGPAGLVVASNPPIADDLPDAKALERKGRRWLIWSFVFCPCHLPLSMAVIASVFGGSAFGALVGRNALGTGIVLGTIYAIGVGIGFRHLRKATKGIDCSDGACTI